MIVFIGTTIMLSILLGFRWRTLSPEQKRSMRLKVKDKDDKFFNYLCIFSCVIWGLFLTVWAWIFLWVLGGIGSFIWNMFSGVKGITF